MAAERARALSAAASTRGGLAPVAAGTKSKTAGTPATIEGVCRPPHLSPRIGGPDSDRREPKSLLERPERLLGDLFCLGWRDVLLRVLRG